MKAAQSKARYGSVKEITAQDYVEEVNKAGDGVWVVLHLYRTGYPCVRVCGGVRVCVCVCVWGVGVRVCVCVCV